ncbi:MAG: hypothetical protein KJP08_00250 [Gammaproteobacteria bacterium]|nr:hypothetical protein [Gammaproteobacteria bacterium]NNF49939.1 hypothetical protein [Woeseiaceae bacterium]MBT8093210.1 hypothetical protein [Gammaproteobacteria bacterium]MBT8106016.1 hypothetical protein [Gammaproteobacteria bacterium]NNK26030.1 hypothetical protein [Woeseiaceae bacterium]
MMQRTAILLVAILCAACAEFSGVFEPDCMAMEGDRFVFAGGTFEWHKFTDERRIDADGNLIDPFPGYPLTGTVVLRGSTVELTTAAGDRLDDYFLLERGGSRYLLTREQHAAVTAGGDLPACVLRRSDEKSPN